MNGGAKLRELFVEGLKDAFFAEKLVLRALKKMARQTISPDLKTAFEAHIGETQNHVERLLRIFDEIGWPDQVDNPVRGETYDAIVDVVDDTRQAIDGLIGPGALDAAFAASAQAVEHYEIARYSLLHTWARQLDLIYAAQLLQDTLAEEIRMEKLVGQLAADNLHEPSVLEQARIGHAA
jgi:ferritin-like metal-binding protein YciE